MKLISAIFLILIILVPILFAAEEIDFESRKYKVIHSSGYFGTHGYIAPADTLEFRPKELIESKPGRLDLIKSENRIELGSPYLILSEGDFRLIVTDTNKFSEYKSYSFVSERKKSKIRFDVTLDKGMIITYERDAIIVGVVVLDLIK